VGKFHVQANGYVRPATHKFTFKAQSHDMFATEVQNLIQLRYPISADKIRFFLNLPSMITSTLRPERNSPALVAKQCDSIVVIGRSCKSAHTDQQLPTNPSRPESSRKI
jgi:hypothetical protein